VQGHLHQQDLALFTSAWLSLSDDRGYSTRSRHVQGTQVAKHIHTWFLSLVPHDTEQFNTFRLVSTVNHLIHVSGLSFSLSFLSFFFFFFFFFSSSPSLSPSLFLFSLLSLLSLFIPPFSSVFFFCFFHLLSFFLSFSLSRTSWTWHCRDLFVERTGWL
jgi:hypothetical protein